jgi:hypothetical protein
MKTPDTACAQKIPALAVKGYAGIFCHRTTAFTFLINLFQDDLS